MASNPVPLPHCGFSQSDLVPPGISLELYLCPVFSSEVNTFRSLPHQ